MSILRSSSWTRWLPRNIHILNNFHFTYIFFSQTILLSGLTIWVAEQVYYRKHELLTLCEHISSSPVFVGWVRIAHILVVCVVCLCFAFFCPMLPIRLHTTSLTLSWEHTPITASSGKVSTRVTHNRTWRG